VYFASTRTGRYEIFKIPVEGGSTVQLTKHGGQLPVESPDGKFVYYEKGPTFAHEFEPWRVPVNGGDEEPVLENLGSRWTLAKDGFYYYEQDQRGDLVGTWLLKFVEFATGKNHVVAALAGMPLIGHRPAVSPDGRTILYGQRDLNETDVMLMEEFQ
jgi:Tol biopolymer transport system component